MANQLADRTEVAVKIEKLSAISRTAPSRSGPSLVFLQNGTSTSENECPRVVFRTMLAGIQRDAIEIGAESGP